MHSYNSGTSDLSNKSNRSDTSKLLKISHNDNIYVEKIKKIAQYIFDGKLVTIVGELHHDKSRCSFYNKTDIIGLYKLLKNPILISEGLTGSYNFDKIKENIKKYHHINVRQLVSKDYNTLYYEDLSNLSLNYIYNTFMIPLRTFLKKQINLENTKFKLFQNLSKSINDYSKEIYFSQLFTKYYTQHLEDLERFITFFENNYSNIQLSTKYKKVLLDIPLINTGIDTKNNITKMLKYIYAFMEDIMFIKTIINSENKNFMIVCGTFHYNNIVRFFTNLKCTKLFKKSSVVDCLKINNMLRPSDNKKSKSRSKSRSKSKSKSKSKSNDKNKNKKRPMIEKRISIKKIKN